MKANYHGSLLSLCSVYLLVAFTMSGAADVPLLSLGSVSRIEGVEFPDRVGVYRGSVTEDGNTLYYDFWSEGRGWIWRAVREPGGDFVSSPLAVYLGDSVSFPAVSPDGSRLYFTLWLGLGGGDGAEIWFAEKSEGSDEFDIVERLEDGRQQRFVNDPPGSGSWSLMGGFVRDEQGREVEIFYTRGLFKLWCARFVEPGNPRAGFHEARWLDELYPDGYAGYDFPGGLSPNGLHLFWSDRDPYAGNNVGPRPGGYGCADMWMATRPCLDRPFGTPVNLGSPPNTGKNGEDGCRIQGNEVAPTVSPDGKYLIFATNRSGLWQAEIEAFPDVEPCLVFHRGDANADNTLDIADAIFTLGYLFANGPAPSCLDAADTNDDGAVDIADATAVLSHLFAGAGDLPDPFGECGLDPTPDDPELGCESFPPCEGQLR